jgi:hypothetical protein
VRGGGVVLKLAAFAVTRLGMIEAEHAKEDRTMRPEPVARRISQFSSDNSGIM